ncbi:hypothetical protein J7T55_002288 [Diaporthe amygdali]|uniref:uncharacterized protein n=1 Tax=Phomopsis amygdali TaxID=1214568 RepID=UPI0022FE9D8F|nr:uncharacterized protein J7T55_002288 [Diaporthe amygdali]KAJ0109096.1 hypothetical protein J7T55_002288 [Diaporthe amygdali]
MRLSLVPASNGSVSGTSDLDYMRAPKHIRSILRLLGSPTDHIRAGFTPSTKAKRVPYWYRVLIDPFPPSFDLVAPVLSQVQAQAQALLITISPQ